MAYFEVKGGVGLIPEGTTELCDYSFCGCSELERVVIPNSVKYIGYCSFHGCENLLSVTIPEGMEKIEDYAFTDCIGLAYVYVKAQKPPIGGFFMFDYFIDAIYNYPIGCLICVPAGSGEVYKTAEHWCKYANMIFEYDFETDEILENHTDKPLENEIWYTNGNTLKPISPNEIPFNVNVLSNLYYYDRGCWIIKFDAPLTYMQYWAFKDCEELISITFPDTLNYIHFDSFCGCKNLIRINGKPVSDEGR